MSHASNRAALPAPVFQSRPLVSGCLLYNPYLSTCSTCPSSRFSSATSAFSGPLRLCAHLRRPLAPRFHHYPAFLVEKPRMFEKTYLSATDQSLGSNMRRTTTGLSFVYRSSLNCPTVLFIATLRTHHLLHSPPPLMALNLPTRSEPHAAMVKTTEHRHVRPLFWSFPPELSFTLCVTFSRILPECPTTLDTLLPLFAQLFGIAFSSRPCSGAPTVMPPLAIAPTRSQARLV